MSSNDLARSIHEIPRYQSHKVVRAAKIIGVKQVGAGKGAILGLDCDISVGVNEEWLFKHSPYVGGYFVVYEDGYQSFSPADALDNGYFRLYDNLSSKTDEYSQVHNVLKYFKYDHLPEELQKISKPFALLALQIQNTMPFNAETATAMRKLLEAKDCAVRSVIS